MSSESKGIRYSDCQRNFHRNVRSIIQITFRIGFIKVDCRRYNSILKSQHSSYSFGSSCCSKEMTDRTFYRTHMGFMSIITQSQLESYSLCNIVESCTGTVGVYIEDIIRGISGFIQGKSKAAA